MVKGSVMAVPLALDPELVFVVAVPDRPLSTSKARQALPHEVSRADAAFNLGRMGLLLAGLADHPLLIREATEDRLHQDYRSPLFPEAPKLLGRLLGGGPWPSVGRGPARACSGSAPGARRPRWPRPPGQPWPRPGCRAGC